MMTINRIKVKEKEMYYCDFDGKLDQIILDLQKCKEKGWEGMQIEYCGYDGAKDYYLYKYREETDEEYAARMKELEKKEEQKLKEKEKRRKMYEKLKEEFGND